MSIFRITFGDRRYPPTEESAVEQFGKIRNSFPGIPCPQQLQHFWITFETKLLSEDVAMFLDHLATSIGFYYPICYAIHEDQSHLHAHFVVSTVSYFPPFLFLQIPLGEPVLTIW